MNQDNATFEQSVLAAGYQPMTASSLMETFSGKTVWGEFGADFRFVSAMKGNGHCEGLNNVGTHVFGTWSVDMQAHTLISHWENYWGHTIVRGYDVDGKLKVFDTDTGAWRATFTRILDGCTDPLQIPK